MMQSLRSLFLYGCLGVCIAAVLPLHAEPDFLGNIHQSNDSNFSTYWNQVTPENAGKWGVVENNRNSMSWNNLDATQSVNLLLGTNDASRGTLSANGSRLHPHAPLHRRLPTRLHRRQPDLR